MRLARGGRCWRGDARKPGVFVSDYSLPAGRLDLTWCGRWRWVTTRAGAEKRERVELSHNGRIPKGKFPENHCSTIKKLHCFMKVDGLVSFFLVCIKNECWDEEWFDRCCSLWFRETTKTTRLALRSQMTGENLTRRDHLIIVRELECSLGGGGPAAIPPLAPKHFDALSQQLSENC